MGLGSLIKKSIGFQKPMKSGGLRDMIFGIMKNRSRGSVATTRPTSQRESTPSEGKTRWRA